MRNPVLPSLYFRGVTFLPLLLLILHPLHGQVVWTQRNPLPTGNSLSACLWAGSQLVAVGAGGVILTSPDGKAWTSRKSGTRYTLSSVAWTGTQIVAVGQLGTILTSGDGVTWTQRPSGSTKDFHKVLWTGTRLVVLAGSAAFLSEDGNVWIEKPIPAGRAPKAGVWADSQLVGVGLVTVVTSKDGETWQDRSPDLDYYDLSGITWTGKQLLAVSRNGAIYTSPDGAAWEKPVAWAANNLNAVAWTGEQYVAVGDSGVVLTSPDGLAWSKRGSGTNRHLADVIWTGTRLVAVGAYGTILLSADGISWSPSRTGFTYPLVDVAWSGSLFAAVSVKGEALTSSDGIDWTLTRSDTSLDIRKMVWTGNRFVAVGYNGSIMSSADGKTWVTASPPVRNDLFCLVWTGNALVAAGERGTVLTSPDGIEWTQQAYGSARIINNLFWTGSRLVVFEGIDSVRFSDDAGRTWTAKPTSKREGRYFVTWSGSRFVAITEPTGGSAAVASADGIEWTPIAQWRNTLKIRCMIPNGEEVIATGLEGIFVISPEKKSLERLDSTVLLEFGAVARGGDRFVGIGAGALVMTSPIDRPMSAFPAREASRILRIHADAHRLRLDLPASLQGRRVQVGIYAADGSKAWEVAVNHAGKELHLPAGNLRRGQYTVVVYSDGYARAQSLVWLP